MAENQSISGPGGTKDLSLYIVTGTGQYSTDNAKVYLGDRYYSPASKDDYWVLVFDRRTLDLKLNTIAGPSALPKGIEVYDGNPNYMLIVIAAVEQIFRVPQGPFHEFLKRNGAYKSLEEVELMWERTGSNEVEYFNYVLVSVMSDSDSDLPAVGTERLAYKEIISLSMKLIAVPVGNDIFYTPVIMGAA